MSDGLGGFSLRVDVAACALVIGRSGYESVALDGAQLLQDRRPIDVALVPDSQPVLTQGSRRRRRYE